MKSPNLVCTLTLIASFALTLCTQAEPTNAPAAKPAAVAKDTNEVAVIKTTDGTMVIGFWPDVAPNTVANFKKLANKGFYDGTCFHRIIKGFMVQGGDPLTKDPSKQAMWGTGGPGYTIKGETNTRPDRGHQLGVISMANSGSPDTAGSQFFICLASQPQLNGKYTTFGKLIKGYDVLDKIGNAPCTGPNSMGEYSIPKSRINVISIKIVPEDSVK